ncbi:MAG: carboxy terminal-processing peptidase [Ferruginibacter sp.]
MRKFLLPMLVCFSVSTQAQQTSPTLKQKAFVLVRFLQKNHYQPLVWNDTSSAMLFDKWLEHLDDEKLFLTKNNMAVLNTYKTKLDDELNGEEWNFFKISSDIYYKQLLKVDSIIKVITAKPFDFSKPDNIEWPNRDYAADDNALYRRWTQYLKWQLLNKVAEKLSNDKKELIQTLPADFVQLESTVRLQQKKQEIGYLQNLISDPATFISEQNDAYLNSIAWCYDPHTEYMNLHEKNEFETEMSASEYTVGCDLTENDKGEKLINFLQPGSSAWVSGKLHKDDVLLKIKINKTETDAEDASLEELEAMLSGSSQDEVEITVRTKAGEVNKVKLSKDKISDDENVVKSYVLHGTKNIGYINLPGFYSRETDQKGDEANFNGCANDVSKEIVKLKKDTIAGLIIDLRSNGGGSMWEAMQLAGIFIDLGPVASVKDRDGKVHFLKDPNRGTIYDGPLMILVNGASASASEFTSAALQDYNRALIVGGTTYGKGTAQVIEPMDTGTVSINRKYEDFVKVTDEKFYRVNGSTTQWQGVIPDIQLPDLYANDVYKEKANKSALQPDQSKIGMYNKSAALPIDQLKIKSAQRVSNSIYYNEIKEFNKWTTSYYAGRTIPLQWPTYVTHYKAITEKFGQLSDDDDTKKDASGLAITNNSFDNETVVTSTKKSKEINDTYVKHLKTDKTLEEGYHIMMDWINN